MLVRISHYSSLVTRHLEFGVFQLIAGAAPQVGEHEAVERHQQRAENGETGGGERRSAAGGGEGTDQPERAAVDAARGQREEVGLPLGGHGPLMDRRSGYSE